GDQLLLSHDGKDDGHLLVVAGAAGLRDDALAESGVADAVSRREGSLRAGLELVHELVQVQVSEAAGGSPGGGARPCDGAAADHGAARVPPLPVAPGGAGA